MNSAQNGKKENLKKDFFFYILKAVLENTF